MRILIHHVRIMLRRHDRWQEAVLEEDQERVLAVIHHFVRTMTRIDSATMGFAADMYYGKRQERLQRRLNKR